LAECPKCRAAIEDRAAFCGECGYRFSVDGPAAEAADPLLGTVVDGRYRVIDLIGRGGMGSVYRVEHVKMGKIMAMKLLHGEFSHDSDVARRFRREAQAVSKLSHANNVSVFDFGTYDGLMYLVMEYIDGVDLAEHLRLHGIMPPPMVVAVMIQVCSGLMDAHAKGIVHRDLKPENIILSTAVDQSGIVKVVDFGLAQLREGPGRTKITQQGSLVGTPYYMAPEHIRGEKVDARTDIYALGAVMFKLLTGDPPFSAPTPMGIITMHLTEEAVAPSTRVPDRQIPPEIDALVLKAMSKDPAARFPSAEDMRRALLELAVALDPAAFGGRYGADRSGSVWQIGEAARAGALPSSWTMGSATPVVTHFPQAAGTGLASPQPRPSTITIGAREMAVGTRSDVIRFERSMKRKKTLWLVFGVLALLAALAGGCYFFFLCGRDDSNPAAETEPNDSPREADTLTPGILLQGFIGPADPQGDIDWYRLDGPARGSWALEVAVSGVPGADLALQLVDSGTTEAILTVNESGAGGPEVIHPVVVDAARLYLMVQEVRRPGVPAGSFREVPYGLVYWMFDPTTVEREPNDTASTATAASIGKAVRGTLSPEEDKDWYCLPSGVAAAYVQVFGLRGADVTLSIVAGAGAREVTFNGAPAGGDEVVALQGMPSPVCVSVRRASADARGIAAVADGSYQIVFQ
jgi:serine/threonine-protein kinase